MSAPMTAFGQAAFDYLAPIEYDDASRGGVLACICGAVGEMFRDVEELVRAQPGRQPWQQAFDIDRCPDFHIPWLGQCIGVRVTAGVDPDVQRAQVKAEDGLWRGGTSPLVKAIQMTLTGTQKVILTQRAGGDAWAITAITDPAETPDPAATNRAGQAAKVAGLLLTITQRSVPEFADGTLTFAAVGSTVTFASATFTNVT